MSYRRRFSKVIDVPIEISIDSPSASASQDGRLSTSRGSVTIYYNGTSRRIPISVNSFGGSDHINASQTIDVDIEVDTSPFDRSISDCNTHVNALTGSVAATEIAQVQSIKENSEQIASTIIKGFFKNVQADISTQVMQLSKRVESRLIHLREQARTLISKKEQMEVDYHRTRSRYEKIFADLNNELEHRVKALDEPIFKMVQSIEHEEERMLNSDFTEVASVVAKENAVLSAQISAAMTKKRAHNAITQAIDFLRVQKETDFAINRSTISELKGANGAFFLPVCYFEASENKGVMKRNIVYDKQKLTKEVESRVNDSIFLNYDAVEMRTVERENVEKFFTASVNEAFQAASTPHETRVVNTISKLFFE